MMHVLHKAPNKGIVLCPCPFCGESAEWVLVQGDDYVIRCSKCHAATPEARWAPEEAAAAWNNHHVLDNHFTIASDTRIDTYLKSGVQKILFSEPLNTSMSQQCKDGKLCSDAVIVTEDALLVIEAEKCHLLYDKISDYGRNYFNNSIIPDGTEIHFVRSRWRRQNLLSLDFKSEDTRITIAPKADNGCMVIYKTKIYEKGEAYGDWQYGVVGNITRTHVDAQGILRHGSSAFRGGTKVYLCGKYWYRTNRTIGTIGLNRFKRYVYSEVPTDLIENVRCQKVRKPSVLAIMADWEFSDCWWSNRANDRVDTQEFVEYWKCEVNRDGASI